MSNVRPQVVASAQLEVFRRLHASLLKPRGFRKVSAHSERAVGHVHQAVACFSSRFNTSERATFTLEFRVSHEAFFHLYYPGKQFPGLGEKSFMPLVTWRPTEPHTNAERWWVIESTHDAEDVEASAIQYLEAEGLQILERTQTVEGIVEFCKSMLEFRRYQPHSWALYFLGRNAEARAVIEAAVQNAPHENARKVAHAWLVRLGA